jgi:hypothetical protein
MNDQEQKGSGYASRKSKKKVASPRRWNLSPYPETNILEKMSWAQAR